MIAVKFTPIADRDTKTATIVKQVRESIGRKRGREREGEVGREKEGEMEGEREKERESSIFNMTIFFLRLATCAQ